MIAPSRAMMSAVARPMPLATAVIKATLSVKRIAPPFLAPLDVSWCNVAL